MKESRSNHWKNLKKKSPCENPGGIPWKNPRINLERNPEWIHGDIISERPLTYPQDKFPEETPDLILR